MAGLLLGASLWYVARRLYGNLGGYIALGLYCFSPMAITRSSQIQPDILGAWGAFGLVFTGIAAAHTLYAPRDVVLWNWKRILADGHFHRAVRRHAVDFVGGAASDPGVHAVGGSHSSEGGRGDLRGSLCRRTLSAVGSRELSAIAVCASAAHRQLDRIFSGAVFRQDRRTPCWDCSFCRMVWGRRSCCWCRWEHLLSGSARAISGRPLRSSPPSC